MVGFVVVVDDLLLVFFSLGFLVPMVGGVLMADVAGSNPLFELIHRS